MNLNIVDVIKKNCPKAVEIYRKIVAATENSASRPKWSLSSNKATEAFIKYFLEQSDADKPESLNLGHLALGLYLAKERGVNIDRFTQQLTLTSVPKGLEQSEKRRVLQLKQFFSFVNSRPEEFSLILKDRIARQTSHAQESQEIFNDDLITALGSELDKRIERYEDSVDKSWHERQWKGLGDLEHEAEDFLKNLRFYSQQQGTSFLAEAVSDFLKAKNPGAAIDSLKRFDKAAAKYSFYDLGSRKQDLIRLKNYLTGKEFISNEAPVVSKNPLLRFFDE